MHKNNFISSKESVKLLSILILALLFLIVPSAENVNSVIWWCLVLLLLGNIRKLNNRNKISYFCRMSLYFLPYSFPIIMEGKILLNLGNRTYIAIGLAFLCFFVWLFVNYRSIQLMLSKHVIIEAYKESGYQIFLRIYNFIGAAISEELYFRQYILSLKNPLFINCLISIIYFILAHWLLPWSRKYSKRDFLNQGLIGTVNVFLFIWSKSVIPCIILHLLVNSPNIIRLIKIYDRYYLRPTRYDLPNINELSELEL